MTELAAPQISSLMEALPGIAQVLRSPVASAMVDLVRAGAGLGEFRIEDAEELLRFGVRRNLLDEEEVERVLAEVREATKGRKAAAKAEPARKVATAKKAPAKAAPTGATKPARKAAGKAAGTHKTATRKSATTPKAKKAARKTAARKAKPAKAARKATKATRAPKAKKEAGKGKKAARKSTKAAKKRR